MIHAPFEMAEHDDNNPLDLAEDFVQGKGWTYTRDDSDMLVVKMPGQKTNFDVCMEWQEEFSALLFAVTLPVTISKEQLVSAAKTLDQVNQNIWLGHFDLSNRNTHPTFRHTMLLRMIPAGIAVDMIIDLMDIALAECNRFYPTFQMVQADDAGLQDNLHAAVFETVGEA